jgi:branched-chain amino acid transport system ATP-binding protein
VNADTDRSLAIAARDLHVYYGESYILQGVSLDVPRAATTGILGRNGVGKTTLVHTLVGMVDPRRGSINILGQDVTHARSWRRARVGVALVPQGRRVFPSLTVLENIEIAGEKSGEWPVERILDLFPNLKERIAQRAGTLSGGEQQMLAIARALHTAPDVLLLDEPSEGLAPMIVERVKELLLELKVTSMTLVLVEQNLNFALDVADHVHVMAKGEVVFAGTTDELRERPDVQHDHLGV